MRPKTIIAGACIALASYVLACVPNSIKVSKELKTLSEEFINTAKYSDSKRVNAEFYDPKLETARLIDYNGKLDKIIEKRNDYLRSNHASLFDSWRASCDNNGKYARAPTNAFCHNPFIKIKPYKN